MTLDIDGLPTYKTVESLGGVWNEKFVIMLTSAEDFLKPIKVTVINNDAEFGSESLTLSALLYPESFLNIFNKGTFVGKLIIRASFAEDSPKKQDRRMSMRAGSLRK